MPKTMAALTFIRKGRLEWRDVPAPQLHGPHEALVRPIVASRCDGDCLFLFHDFSRALQLGAALHVIDPEVRELGDRPFAGPFAYGHECIAEVIDVGDAVRGVTHRPARRRAVGDLLRRLWRLRARPDLALRAQGIGARGLRLRRAHRRLGRHGQRRAAGAVRGRHAGAGARRGLAADAGRRQRQSAGRLADGRPAPARRAWRGGPGGRGRGAQHRALRRRHRRRAGILPRRLRRRRSRQPRDRRAARGQPHPAAAAGPLAARRPPSAAHALPHRGRRQQPRGRTRARDPRRWRRAASARPSASTSAAGRRCRSGTCF